MSYDPVQDDEVQAPAGAAASWWPQLIANDAACFDDYLPSLAVPMQGAYATAREFRFRWWGNEDDQQLKVSAWCTSTSGPHTVSLATTGTDSDTDSVDTATVTEFPVLLDAAGPTQEVVVSNATLGGGTLTYHAIGAQLDTGGGIGATLYPSGVRRVGSLWGTSGKAVSSGLVTRLRANPIALAKDRPIVVAAHVSDCLVAVGSKNREVWGVTGTADDTWYQVGAMRVLGTDARPRSYLVDAYTTDGGSAEFAVRVGTSLETWSGTGWHTWRVTLSANAQVPVRALIKPGNGNAAAIRSLLVWRTIL